MSDDLYAGIREFSRNPEAAITKPLPPRRRMTREELCGPRHPDIYAAFRHMPPDSSVTKDSPVRGRDRADVDLSGEWYPDPHVHIRAYLGPIDAAAYLLR